MWVVGAVNVDHSVRVRVLPAPGETVADGAYRTAGGGKGANQAVAAARAGARVVLTGAVGDDPAGVAALDQLRAEGVDVSTCTVVPGEPTGVALIVVDDAGENAIAVAPGANAQLSARDVHRALDALAEPPAVCLLSLEIPSGAALAAAQAAARIGAALVLNPSPADAVADELLDCGPIVTPNRGEATALTGQVDAAAAAAALGRRTGAPVVVTLGSAGVLVHEAGRDEALPAERVTVVDSTGAGDVFSGTLAARLALGDPVRAAASTAQAAAAASVGRPGAR